MHAINNGHPLQVELDEPDIQGILLQNPHLRGGIWRINQNSESPPPSTHYDAVRTIAVRRPWVVTGSNDRTVALWRIVKQEDRWGDEEELEFCTFGGMQAKLRCQFRAHEKQVTAVRISDDAERIYSASIDGAIKMHVM